MEKKQAVKIKILRDGNGNAIKVVKIHVKK